MSVFFLGDSDGQGGSDSDVDFGPTADFHQAFMGALWSPAANIAIFLIIYSYRKYWVWLHMLFFAVATFITVISSLPIFFVTGLIDANSTANYDDYSASTLRMHYIIGLVCCGTVTLVSLLGLLTKALNIFNARSKTILLLRRIHTWAGYVIVCLCKANIYILGDDFAGWLVIDLIFLVLYIFWRLRFPKLQAKGITPKYQTKAESIESVKQLQQGQQYVVFANMVYDINPLRYNHPAGYQIIETLKNKQVDRYIYGSCLADQLPEVRMWSHSYKSFTLLGDPIAKIDILPTFQGFKVPQVECQVPKLHLLSKKGNIYQMNLKKKEGPPFFFAKYQTSNQLGRYFGLTLNDSVTRLYTTVNFLLEDNTNFMEKHLQGYAEWVYENQNTKGGKPEETQMQGIPDSDRGLNLKKKKKACAQNKNTIPIMFKSYPKGKFSETIVKGPVNKLIISESKGEGLQLGHTKPGKIILVAGGTGIYPFSDFIDLLFKEQMMIHRPETRQEILQISPVLSSNPFELFTFELMAAFAHIEDMHIITRQQLLFLASVGRMRITFKFRQSPGEAITEGNNISFTKKGFQDVLEDRIGKQNVSRVWICGPPGMNIMVSKFLREKYENPDLYLIV